MKLLCTQTSLNKSIHWDLWFMNNAEVEEPLHLARIVKIIIDQALGCQAKVSMISLFSRYPYCMATGNCRIGDDMSTPLYDKLYNSDVIVLGTPVYWDMGTNVGLYTSISGA